jgi:Ca2+-binding EF-hand superfamily protein
MGWQDMYRGLSKAMDSLRCQGIAQEGSEESRIRAIFNQFDTDGGGTLDREEVAALCKQLGLDITSDELDQSMRCA